MQKSSKVQNYTDLTFVLHNSMMFFNKLVNEVKDHINIFHVKTLKKILFVSNQVSQYFSC